MCVAGTLAGVLVLVNGLSSLDRRFQRFVVPGRVEMQLPEAGTYTLFHEYQSVIDGVVYSTPGGLSGVRFSLREKDGGEIPLRDLTANSRYSFNGRQGVGMFTFTVEWAGTYILTVAPPDDHEQPPAVISVASGFTATLVVTILKMLGVMLVSIFMGAGLIFYVMMQRRWALGLPPIPGFSGTPKPL